MDDLARLPLPRILGTLRQERATGRLSLAQPDGARTLHWRGGRLTQVAGATPGEGQAGDLLARALGQPVLQASWEPMEHASAADEGVDLRGALWEGYRAADFHRLPEGALQGDDEAHWRAHGDVLEALAGSSLTPALAYAASRLGVDPMSLEGIASLTALSREEAARLVAALWAMGVMTREEGPSFALEHPEPAIQERGAKVRGGALGEGSAARAERASDLWLEAQAYAKEGRTSEAIRALEETLRWAGEGRDAYDPWLLLGRLRMGNPAWSHRAMEALRVAARLDARAAEPWVLMGGIYRDKGLAVNAEGCYRRAQALDPRVVIPPPLEPPPAESGEVSPVRRHLETLRRWVKAGRS